VSKKEETKAVPPKVRKAHKPEPTKSGREVLQTLSEDLPVKMTADEREAKIAIMFAKRKELASHRATKKQVVSALKATELKFEAEIENLIVQIESHSCTQSVAVQLEADFDTNTVYFVRTDTGEEIRTRPVSSQERQGMLPVVAGELPPGVTKADEEKEEEADPDDEP
jgi:hypothetical protein